MVESQPKVLQIIPINKPFVAVFRNKDLENQIEVAEIFAIELIEVGNGARGERGVCNLNDGGLASVDSVSDFLGYAKDIREAVKIYGRKCRTLCDHIEEMQNAKN